MKIDISRIKFGKRLRQPSTEEVSDLIGSLSELGQVVSITVTPIKDDSYYDYLLVAGGRRYIAAKALGWGEIEASIIEAEGVRLLELELSENLVRQDFTWQERVGGVYEYVAMLSEIDRECNINYEDRLGLSATTVSNYIKLASYILENPNSNVAKASDYSTALNLMENAIRKKAAAILAVRRENSSREERTVKEAELTANIPEELSGMLKQAVHKATKSATGIPTLDTAIASPDFELKEQTHFNGLRENVRLMCGGMRRDSTEYTEKVLRSFFSTLPKDKIEDFHNKVIGSYKVMDFKDLANDLISQGKKFDFIEADPPYGIDFDVIKNGVRQEEYVEVEAHKYEEWTREHVPLMGELLKESGMGIYWHGSQYTDMVASVLRESFDNVSVVPFYWISGSGRANNTTKTLPSAVEVALIFSNRKAYTSNKVASNWMYFDKPSEAFRWHHTHKPLGLYLYVLEMLLHNSVTESLEVLVPFAGSGISLYAAAVLGMNAVGADLSDANRNNFIAHVSANKVFPNLDRMIDEICK